jgi:hypothetical protein
MTIHVQIVHLNLFALNKKLFNEVVECVTNHVQ